MQSSHSYAYVGSFSLPNSLLPFHHLCKIPNLTLKSNSKPSSVSFSLRRILRPSTCSLALHHPSIPSSCNHKDPSDLQFQETQKSTANMWLIDFKAALGQRVNVEGIVSSVAVFARDQHLALPHVSVADIRHIDWVELHRRGFKGVVFDKDNTITVPYTLSLWPPLQSSMQLCKSVFGNDIAVFSNSAGLNEYDHDRSKARALEKAIGIKVIRHRVKKPAGTAEEIEKHFGCKSSQLIMVGDRPFTDIVYGNRNGFLTILTTPLSVSEEPFIVRQVRKLEVCLMNYWFRRGVKPVSHSLLPDAMLCKCKRSTVSVKNVDMCN